MRPEMAPHFQGPGGPRQGVPMGPLFPGPDGPMMGPRMRGLMPPRMQVGHGVARGMAPGPRPLLPEMVRFGLLFVVSHVRHLSVEMKKFVQMLRYYRLDELVHPAGSKDSRMCT